LIILLVIEHWLDEHDESSIFIEDTISVLLLGGKALVRLKTSSSADAVS